MGTERETHDFLNVESFSQLPFIRPSPSSTRSEKPIRLFGIEFAHSTADGDTANDLQDTSNNTVAKEKGAVAETNSNDKSSNNRRFECHYCCRNFPTSQALGGHQNAHKRERQQAKRAHLHGAAAGTSSYLSDVAHHPFYAPLSYRTTSHALFSSYSSWNGGTAGTNGTASASSRFYGNGAGVSSNSSSSQQQPITGSPLGLWRIPSTTNTVHGGGTAAFLRDRSAAATQQVPLPLLGGDQEAKSGVGGSQGRFGYGPKPNLQQQDLHVSLDLHL